MTSTFMASSASTEPPTCSIACISTFYTIATLFFLSALLDIAILVRLSWRRNPFEGAKPLLLGGSQDDGSDDESSSETPAQNEQKKNQLATIVLIMLPLALIVRGIDMVTSNPGLYMLRSIRSQDIKSIVVGGFPGYIFLCTNLIFVLFWMIAYYRTFDKGSALMSSVRKIFGILVAVVFAVWGALIVAIAVVKEQPGNPERIRETVDTIHDTEVVYASTLSMLLALVFLIFGVRVYAAMKKSSVTINSKSAMISRKIAFLTVLCTAVFTVRAIITMIDNFVVVDSPSLNDTVIFTLRIVLLVAFEFAPSVTLMFFLNRTDKPSEAKLSSSRKSHQVYSTFGSDPNVRGTFSGLAD